MSVPWIDIMKHERMFSLEHIYTACNSVCLSLSVMLLLDILNLVRSHRGYINNCVCIPECDYYAVEGRIEDEVICWYNKDC